MNMALCGLVTPLNCFSISVILLDLISPFTQSLFLNKHISVELVNTNYCGNPNNLFHVEINHSFSKCLEKCLFSRKCNAVNFKRRFNYCGLLLLNETTTKQPGCLYVLREHIRYTGMENDTVECTNNQGPNCSLHNGTYNSAGCVPIRSLSHGLVFGNRYSISSRLFIMCEPGFNINVDNPSIICKVNGEWSEIPDCKEMSSTTSSTPITSTTSPDLSTFSTTTTTTRVTTSSIMSTTQVASTTTQTHQSPSCVSSCTGKPNGNYQSCDTCTGYVACSGESLFNMLCPASLFWDNSLGACTFVSTTCP